MKLLLFALADYVNVSDGRKLNVMGLFNTIRAHDFPCRHPQLFVVIKLAVELTEVESERTVQVLLLEADGRSLLGMHGKLRVPGHQADGTPEVSLIMQVNDLVFDNAGTYEFRVVIDDEQLVESLPLYVVHSS